MFRYLPAEGSATVVEAIDTALANEVAQLHLKSTDNVDAQSTSKASRTQSRADDSGYASLDNSPFKEADPGKERNIKSLWSRGKKRVLKPCDQQATPPQRDRFEDLKILFGRSLAEFLQQKKVTFRALQITLVMMQEADQPAQPYVIVSCEKTLMRTVKRFFEQEHVMDELLPTQDPRLPHFQLLVREGFQLLTDVAQYEVFTAAHPNYAPLPGESLCGSSILISTENGIVRATLGGTILATDRKGNTRMYGMTAGHILQTKNGTVDGEVVEDTASIDTLGGIEHDHGNVPKNGVEYNQAVQGLCYEDDVVFEPSDTCELEGSLFSDNDEDVEIIFDSDTDQQSASTACTPLEVGDRIGTVVWPTSLEIVSKLHQGSDWLLLHLDEELSSWKTSNVFNTSLANGIDDDAYLWHYGQKFTPENFTSREVRIANRRHKAHKATLRRGNSAVMVAPNNTFIEAYSLEMKENTFLYPGDSGSWIYDDKSHEVLGHIVGRGIFGDGLVMPMDIIMADIKSSFGLSQLPTFSIVYARGPPETSLDRSLVLDPPTKKPSSGSGYDYDSHIAAPFSISYAQGPPLSNLHKIPFPDSSTKKPSSGSGYDYDSYIAAPLSISHAQGSPKSNLHKIPFPDSSTKKPSSGSGYDYDSHIAAPLSISYAQGPPKSSLDENFLPDWPSEKPSNGSGYDSGYASLGNSPAQQYESELPSQRSSANSRHIYSVGVNPPQPIITNSALSEIVMIPSKGSVGNVRIDGHLRQVDQGGNKNDVSKQEDPLEKEKIATQSGLRRRVRSFLRDKARKFYI